MNMIEKVARAQAAVCSDCKKLGKVDWKAHLEDARAAITAMLEPSEEMISKGNKHLNFHPSEKAAMIGYQAMIDAALKE